MSPSLEDRFAIQDLLYCYARAADQRDARAFATCFADGQVWLTGPGFELRDAGQTMTGLAAFEWTMHKVHNHEFHVEDNQASGYTYCVATHVKNEDGRRIKLDWYICYKDELVKEDGHWRFRKRHLEVGLVETVPLTQ